jgi:hypothetical protein
MPASPASAKCGALSRRLECSHSGGDRLLRSLKRWLRQKMQKIILVLFEPITKQLSSDIDRLRRQLERANLPDREIAIANPLTACGRRFFSQNDEDGILREILRRLEISRSNVFLEFGVGNGTECNTIILLALGWRGLWVGGELLSFDLPEESRLQFLHRWITRENAAQLACEGLVAVNAEIGDVRVASVDIDGNDGPIVRALLAGGVLPDVFIVEYNAKFPPDVEFEMPYDERHVWQGDDYQGVSLQSWIGIFASMQYSIVACNENGTNAFFVKTEYMQRFADVPKNIDQIYRIGHYGFYEQSGHRTSPQTVHHLATR